MKLVMLYGPPATGKLTVATELEKHTDLKIFHNHMTVDLCKEFLDFGTEGFWQLNDRIRLDVIETTAKANIPGLIFTFCYANPEDNGFIEKLINICTNNNITFCPVFLHAPDEVLYQRVLEESRKKYKKVKDVEKLKETLQKWKHTALPQVASLEINNEHTIAQDVAQQILKHYNL